MNPSSWLDAGRDSNLQVLWEDGERVFCRGWRDGSDGDRKAVLCVLPAAEPPTPGSLDRLEHEYALKDDLDDAWAVRSLQLVRERGRTMLVLEDPGGEPLAQLLGQPMEIGRFLRLAVALSAALGRVHQRGLIHKDIKPANVLVNSATGQVWLTGFGIASRLPRERQSPEPPEFIAGTLAYMAPEQTGRMNRSIDSRSDLYSLGVTLYEMLTGSLPFTASDPMEWVHCHIARQPVPPVERLRDLPVPVSALICKLLAKTAEERYQTAAGVESDLRRCLAQWERQRRIEEFPLGENDTSGRLRIPEKLYGRAREIDTLLAAFDRVAAGGAPELVLVSGYSGIGKSSVVNELHKVLVRPRGRFAAGKFDQYKRDIPYATLAQAFQNLVRRLLGKSEAEFQRWREQFQQALDPNARLIVDLVPELKLIIGEQPPVPDLPPRDAQNRFQLVFRRFINVFARPEHPLALFLDDLQWIDAATLDLLEHLLTHSDVRHLLLVGAYRDNEVSPSHPFVRTLGAIGKAGARVEEIVLAPLGLDDIGQLVADATHCEPERVRPLAQLLQEKTGGNPFFAIQFFTALAEEGLLALDSTTRAWQWNMDRIRAKSYTDNVVDLMAAKLKRFSSTTQEALKQLACLGNVAKVATVALVHGVSEDKIHADLGEAVRTGLIFRDGGNYSFLHDRVQEAAYALVPDSERAAAHLRVGRLLASNLAPNNLFERIFEIVNHLNRGAKLIASHEEYYRVAELNLIAGQRAKAAAAYASALAYFAMGSKLLPDDRWQQRYELTFALELNRAECEFLCGNLEASELLLTELLKHCVTDRDKSAGYRLKIELDMRKSAYSQAIQSACECLELFNVRISPVPTREEVATAFADVWRKLNGRPIESLIALPRADNPEVEAAMRLLETVHVAALVTNEALLHLVLCRMVDLTLDFGITDASPHGFAWFGVQVGHLFGRYAEGYGFACLATDLVERHGLFEHKGRVLLSLEVVSLWTCPITVALDTARAAFAAAVETGAIAQACFACHHIVTDMLLLGDHLDETAREVERGLAFVHRVRYNDTVDVLLAQQRFIENMRGNTSSFSSFDGEDFNSPNFEALLTSDRSQTAIFWYWVIKGKARYISGDFEEAARAFGHAKPLRWSSSGHIQLVDYHLFSALTLAILDKNNLSDEIARRLELEGHCEQFRRWAENCPTTFFDKHTLVAAEIARIESRDIEAMRLYDHAIRLAHEHGFIHHEAIAKEVAARFYEVRGFETIAFAYFRDARSSYLHWGANGKVRQLDRLYPRLAAAEGHHPTATIGSPAQQLDLASVVKASQALSGEIVLPRLVERLMTIALENAGADRGLLILPAQDDHLIQARARASGDKVEVVLCQQAITGLACPETLVRYVIRTHESVLLDDTSRPNLFSEDDYLRDREAKSILCVPLLKQGRLTGVLYLENTLASYAFTPNRTAILELLAAQAAISLENTRLYGELQEREAKVRRLIDANIIGISVWNFEGRIIEANEAFLDIVGYSRDDLVSDRVHWTALTPSEWSDAVGRSREELMATGSCKPYEKEYFRKDGTRVPILIGAATFGERRDQGVAFVLDLTERKQAEENLRASERRYREAQMELAHVNRVATMGQLSASIAHEVKQPITAAITSADAGLRWLAARPPDLEEVRNAFDDVVRAGNRAGEVVDRIRALIKKVPARNANLDINETILETIALIRNEMLRHGVVLQTELADGLPRIWGDRIQLQQVILNLIMNAIEAMSEAGEGPRELLIGTSANAPAGVMVAIRDTGPGLKPESLARLFDPFYTTKPAGMGMGLAICRSITEAHGGRLWAEANTPGGAAFLFTVPAQVYAS